MRNTRPRDVACPDCLARPQAACRWIVGPGPGSPSDYHSSRQKAALEKECAELRAENMCDACAGLGTPTSGPGCMCGGSGKMSDAAHYLRERYAAEKIRADGLQSLLDRLCLVSADADLTEAGLRYEVLQILSGAGK